MLENLGVGVQAEPGLAEAPPPAPRPLARGLASRLAPKASFLRIAGPIIGLLPLVLGSGFFSVALEPGMAFFPIFGAVLTVSGFAMIARVKSLVRKGSAAPAVVTEARRHPTLGIGGRPLYTVRFRYTSADGVVREASVTRHDLSPGLRVAGAQIYALYDREDPARATMWPV
jgi:hypothetical protein